MARVLAQMVKSSLYAFFARDAELAARVRERDKTVDDFYNSLFRTLLTYMMENPNNITASAHLLFIAKNLERIGDHATNVAEMVYYSATGVYLDEREKGGDSITPGKAGDAGHGRTPTHPPGRGGSQYRRREALKPDGRDDR